MPWILPRKGHRKSSSVRGKKKKRKMKPQPIFEYVSIVPKMTRDLPERCSEQVAGFYSDKDVLQFVFKLNGSNFSRGAKLFAAGSNPLFVKCVEEGILSKYWKPGDWDGFFIGTEDDYDLMICGVCSYLKRNGFPYELKRGGHYGNCPVAFVKTDIVSSAFYNRISIIWYPEAVTISCIVRNFDLECCMVAYDVVADRFVIEESVLDAIRKKESRALRNIAFQGTVPIIK